MRRLAGVERVRPVFDVRVRLEVSVAPGGWVAPEAVFAAVTRAGYGYTARKDEVRLTVTGRVVREEGGGEDRLFLLLDDIRTGPRRLALVPETDREGKVKPAVAEAMRKAADEGAAVEVEGWWRPAQKGEQDAPPRLLVTRIAVSKESREAP